jgi:VanZ family protein
VSKLRHLIKYWLPVLIWMGVIFSASGDTKSMRHSSRIIAPLLLLLFPHLPPQAVSEAVFFVRKLAHMTEFAVLALLLWRAMARHKLMENAAPADARPTLSEAWSWPLAGQVLTLVVLYAASDEFHQRFVPTRQASVLDVLIDASGAALALLGLFMWRRVSRRRL